MRRIIGTLALTALVATACDVTDPTEPSDGGGQFAVSQEVEEPTAADHHVVAFEGSVQSLQAAVAAAGGTLMRAHPEIGVATVGGLDDAGATALAAAEGISDVTRDLLVEWIPSVDGFSTADMDAAGADGHVVGDPTTAFFYPCQWNMTQCNGPGAWMQGEFGAGVKVAVLDTGVDPNHIDLAGRIDLVNSASMLSSPTVCDLFVNDVGTFFDFNFHGSFVSGIVAANGIGVTGVAPDATIVGVKVLTCEGFGTFGDIIAGILYATSVPGVEVINMSLGAYFPKNLPGAGALVAALNNAVNFATSQGVLVVSSAGNGGPDGVGDNLDKDKNFTHVPSQSGSGISIWAGDIDGNLAGYSNFGRSGTWVGAGGGDFTPGSPNVPLPACPLPVGGHGGIVSVCSSFSLFFGCGPASYLFNGSGTSFSAPLAAGVAALVDGKYGGSKNAGQLKTILSRTADDIGRKGTDALFSHGRVNAGNAVQ